MSQRIKRSQDRNNIDSVTISTGGHVTRHARGEEVVVKVPQKTTGDVPGDSLGGLAKASPNFKQIEEPVKPKTKAEEKKVIAESVIKPEAKKIDEDETDA